MINITITVDNLTDVLTIFSRIDILKYTGSSTPSSPINIAEYMFINDGIDQTNNRPNVSNVLLFNSISQYSFVDPSGDSNSWYISRYSNNSGITTSGWSDPIQGDDGSLYYNPIYPSEMNYGTADKLIINKIRLLIGDPVGVARSFGEDALTNFHSDNVVFELQEKGWPTSINIYGTQYNSSVNPSVNGYKYLKFTSPVNLTSTTISGIEQSLDVWYYTFRYSDKQLMEAYDNCIPPAPLTIDNCTQAVYLLQTAYDLLNGEVWELALEDGASISDNRDTYNPTPGLNARDKLLERLKKQLADAIKYNLFSGFSGVRID